MTRRAGGGVDGGRGRSARGIRLGYTKSPVIAEMDGDNSGQQDGSAQQQQQQHQRAETAMAERLPAQEQPTLFFRRTCAHPRSVFAPTRSPDPPSGL